MSEIMILRPRPFENFYDLSWTISEKVKNKLYYLKLFNSKIIRAWAGRRTTFFVNKTFSALDSYK